jgi:hypothetical protein
MRNKRLFLRSRFVLVGAIVCVGALLAVTSVVFAQAGGPSPVVARIARTTGYGAVGPGSSLITPGGGADTAGAVYPPTRADAPTPDKGTLPFTGLDLLLVGLIGAGLLGFGLRLRWSAGRIAAGG